MTRGTRRDLRRDHSCRACKTEWHFDERQRGEIFTLAEAMSRCTRHDKRRSPCQRALDMLCDAATCHVDPATQARHLCRRWADVSLRSTYQRVESNQCMHSTGFASMHSARLRLMREPLAGFATLTRCV